MKKIAIAIYSIMLKIKAAYILFLNRIIIYFSNSHYETFPMIAGKLLRKGSGRLEIGANVTITSELWSNPVGGKSKSFFLCSPGALIKIGNGVSISNSIICAQKSICIEDDVMIGGGCQIYDSDFHSIIYKERMMRPDTNIKTKSVLIKKGAFIGTSSIILKGVTIGERSVIAAGSVVSKSVPDDQIWGGNPAKFIKAIEK